MAVKDGVVARRVCLIRFLGPHLVSAPVGRKVSHEAAAYVVARLLEAPDDLACLGVAQLGVIFIVRVFLLVYHEHLQAGMLGVEIAQVQGVAVASACAVEQRAVVVYGSGAIDDLVKSVAVTVADGERVGTLAIEALLLGLALVQPFFGQLCAVKVDCPYVCVCVVAAAEDYRGIHAVEICHAGQITLGAVIVV